MAVKVSFAGVSLMSDGEGNFTPIPAVFPRRGREFVPMGRSESMLMRELASPGCVHTIELRYYGTNINAVRAIMAQAYNRGIGTLFIRDIGSISNCALVGPPAFGPIRFSKHVGSSASGRGVSVTVSFHQLAES